MHVGYSTPEIGDGRLKLIDHAVKSIKTSTVDVITFMVAS
jgi:hypothetical protein